MELGVKPTITRNNGIDRYHANNIDIFIGDIFTVTKTMLGPVDAIYDRAALVALPENMRSRYTAHVTDITEQASQLLICYEYDQRATEGPPFSISHEEVRRHYAHRYQLRLFSSADVPGGLKEKCAAIEHVWRPQKL